MWAARQMSRPPADFRGWRRSEHTRRRFLLVLAAGSLALLFGRSLLVHMAWSADPFTYNDDARQQIYPFYRYEDPRLFPDDLPARYYLDTFPIGYRLWYMALAPIAGAAVVSKVLPYLLFTAMLTLAGLAAYRLGGLLPAWFTLAFGLSSPYFLARLAGGLPRAWGFTLIAGAIAALVYGRVAALALCALLGAALYPPAAVVCGMALATVLLLLPRQDRGTAAGWDRRKRLIVVALTAAGCVFLLLPAALNTSTYGRVLRPADVGAYPELGVGGRYLPEDRAPFAPLATALLNALADTFEGGATAWAPALDSRLRRSLGPLQLPLHTWLLIVIGGITCAGLIVKVRTDAAARRIGALVLVVCAAYLLARPIAPYFYLPQRYTAYPIPLLAIILFPVAAQVLAGAVGPAGAAAWSGRAGVLLVGGICYGLLGGRGDAKAGLQTFATRDTTIYRFFQTLPKETRLAGWPTDIANNIPYLARRQVLLAQETHQAFHQGYTDEMRRRMRALIDAYYATDPAPLIRLRDGFDVDYLVVDLRHFSTQPPEYFAPFDAWVRGARQAAPRDPQALEVFRVMARAAVYREGSLVVLDLKRVP